jgi:hypothetical protein
VALYADNVKDKIETKQPHILTTFANPHVENDK